MMWELIFTVSESTIADFTRQIRNACAIGLTLCWRPVRMIRSARRTCALGSMCSPRCPDCGDFECAIGGDSIAAIEIASMTSPLLPRTTNICFIKRWSARGRWSVALEDDWKAFRERMQNYMLKAIREAKQNTSWINRNAEYETAVSSFVKALLSPGEQNRFLNDFVPFQQRIARIGLWNSLSQTLLKLTCPGVPDIYQGNDLWDFSLVDPDNRRPVDYERRRQTFQRICRLSGETDLASTAELMETPEDGRLKLYVIWKTLCLRKEFPELFRIGDYVPLEVRGAKANHAVAFIRKFESTSLIVIVPRLVSGLLNGSERPPSGPEVWNDTRIQLPACVCNRSYRNIFTSETLSVEKTETGSAIYLSNALVSFPLALCLQSGTA